MSALERSGTSYWGLVERLDPGEFGNPIGKSAMQVDYVQQWGAGDGGFALRNLQVEPLELGPDAFHPLAIFGFVPGSDGLSVRLQYERNRHDEEGPRSVVRALGALSRKRRGTRTAQ